MAALLLGVHENRAAEIEGAFLRLTGDSMKIEKVAFEPYDEELGQNGRLELRSLDYRLTEPLCAIFIRDGSVMMLDPRHEQTPVLYLNTIADPQAKVTVVACVEGNDRVIGMLLRASLPGPQQSSSKGVYLSFRAASFEHAAQSAKNMLQRLSFRTGIQNIKRELSRTLQENLTNALDEAVRKAEAPVAGAAEPAGSGR